MLRCAKRNKRRDPIWYSLYEGMTEATTEKGKYTLYTGEKNATYSKPQSAYVNVSPAGGDAATQWFGTDLRYDKVLVFDSTGPTEINEYSRLWIDTKPYIGLTLQPHDYEVKQIAVDHNNSTYAIAIERVSRNEQSSSNA